MVVWGGGALDCCSSNVLLFRNETQSCAANNRIAEGLKSGKYKASAEGRFANVHQSGTIMNKPSALALLLVLLFAGHQFKLRFAVWHSI